MAGIYFTTLTVLLSLVAVALCNDLRSGFADPKQRLIFQQKYDYNPSIYQRSEVVNVDTHGNEIISQIEVIDERELKDGEATVIAGGVGQKFVSLQLKGPAVFRGMTFLVRVYAVNSNEFYYGRSLNSGQLNSGYPNYGLKTGSVVYDGQAQEPLYNSGQFIKG